MDAEAGPARRRGGRVLAGAAVLVVLLVTGVVVAVMVADRNADAPVAAVREYVDAIARGDAATANALVDPGVERTLLTDEVLASATEPMTVDEVALGFGADVSADVVDVEVGYTVRGRAALVVLRAQRAGTTAGVLDEWRVLDPLLVPVEVESLDPLLDTAYVSGTRVRAGGPKLGGFPQHRLFAYPGAYEVRGAASRYLATRAVVLDVVSTAFHERPEDSAPARVTARYEPTPELTTTVTSRLTDHVTACFADAARLPPGCPLEAHGYRDRDPRPVGPPVLDSLEYYQVRYEPGRPAEPALRLSAKGNLAVTGRDGGEYHQTYLAYGRLTISPEGDLTITFSAQL